MWYGARDIRVKEIEEPSIEPGKVKIEVQWCGICGSDLHEYLAGPIFLPQEPHPLTQDQIPIVLGHEFSGKVIEVGEGVNAVEVGDRVTIEPILSCGTCPSCRQGYYNVCDQLGFHGLSGGGGGFSEITIVPEYMVHKIPDSMTYEEAALVEPAAVALHAVRRSKLKAGDNCVVFGAGPIGLLIIQAAKVAGASKIVAVEISDKRRELAVQLGADLALNPQKDDVTTEIKQFFKGYSSVCFEVTGVESALNTAIETTGVAGQVVIVSLWEQNVTISPNQIVLKEREIVGSLAYRNIFPSVIKMISDHTFKLDGLVTKKIPISKIVEEGFRELAENKEQIKILVQPRD